MKPAGLGLLKNCFMIRILHRQYATYSLNVDLDWTRVSGHAARYKAGMMWS